MTKSFILVAVVAGLISYKKYKGTTTTFFIKITVYLLFIEIIGGYATLYSKFEFLKSIYNSIFRQNYWWYTITFDVITIILLAVLFQNILQIKYHKSILRYTNYAFILFAIIYLIYNRQLFFYQFFPVLQITGAVLIIMCSVLYYLELLKGSDILNFYKSIYFYIATSIFFWWIVTTPITFYDLYFRAEDWDFIVLKWQLYLLANFFMYSTFTVGLLVSKPEK